jgi:uncharacterized protein
MEQPFVVGKPVSGKYFIDRESEMKKILALLSGTSKGNNNNVILLGLRRTGKSSILLNVKEMLSKRKGVIPVIFDAYGLSTKERFSRSLIDRILQTYIELTDDKRRKENLKKILSQAMEKIEGRIETFDIEFAEYVRFHARLRESKVHEDELLEQALQYAESLGREKDVHFIIMIDEFQDLLQWGDKFLKMFRRLVQAQKHVAYVFSGSAPTIMKKLIYDAKSPFYKQLVEVPVGRLDQQSVSAFVRKRLKSVNLGIDVDALDRVYLLSSGFPDYVQRLGLQIFLNSLESGKKQVNVTMVQAAYDELILQLDPDFNNLFATFSDLEKEILIALSGGFNTYAEMAREVRKPQSSLPKTVMRLMRQDIVEAHGKGRYRITDPILADWLNRRYSALAS